MTTEKKVAANRANSMLSSGPSTSTGKAHSCKNAVTHGFFSKQLSLSEADQVEFDALLSSLANELAPTDTLERDGVHGIARCMFRSTMALGLEARMAQKLLGESDPVGTSAEPVPAPTAWYGSSPQDLRSAKAWMTEVCKDFSLVGVMRTEWKPTFDLLFGPHFFETLTQWPTMHLDAILMAEMLTAKTETFQMPMPYFDEYKTTGKGVIADPRQNEALKGKLLAIQLQHIEDVIRVAHHASEVAISRTGDFSPRYFTTAQRDLHRAIQWYWALKDRKEMDIGGGRSA